MITKRAVLRALRKGKLTFAQVWEAITGHPGDWYGERTELYRLAHRMVKDQSIRYLGYGKGRKAQLSLR